MSAKKRIKLQDMPVPASQVSTAVQASQSSLDLKDESEFEDAKPKDEEHGKRKTLRSFRTITTCLIALGIFTR